MSLMCGGGGGEAPIDPEIAKINAEVRAPPHAPLHTPSLRGRKKNAAFSAPR